MDTWQVDREAKQSRDRFRKGIERAAVAHYVDDAITYETFVNVCDRLRAQWRAEQVEFIGTFLYDDSDDTPETPNAAV